MLFYNNLGVKLCLCLFWEVIFLPRLCGVCSLSGWVERNKKRSNLLLDLIYCPIQCFIHIPNTGKTRTLGYTTGTLKFKYKKCKARAVSSMLNQNGLTSTGRLDIKCDYPPGQNYSHSTSFFSFPIRKKSEIVLPPHRVTVQLSDVYVHKGRDTLVQVGQKPNLAGWMGGVGGSILPCLFNLENLSTTLSTILNHYRSLR